LDTVAITLAVVITPLASVTEHVKVSVFSSPGVTNALKLAYPPLLFTVQSLGLSHA